MRLTRLNFLIKCIVILVGIGFVRPVSAQLWAGLGYNMSLPLGLKNLNYVVNRYNDTRPWLDESMKKFRYLDGLALRCGYWKTYSFLDVGITGASQRVSATGTPPPVGSTIFVESQRDLKLSMNTIDICYGRLIRNRDVNSYGAGVMVGYGNFRIKTRRDDPESIKKRDYTDIIKENAFLFGFCGRWMSSDPGVTVEPFIRFSVFGIGRANAKDVNEKINENTYMEDPASLKIYPATFGIKVLLSVTTRK